MFVNFCCCFQDQGGIRIGDNVLIGHRVTIAALNRDLDPACRQDLHPAPVIVGNNVWIGADVTICPGAVVLGEIPANAIVAGVPAKFIREVPGAGQAGR